MQRSARHAEAARRTPWSLAAVALLLGGGQGAYAGNRAEVAYAEIRPCGASHCLDAGIDYRLAQTLYQALHDGIALEMQTDVAVYRPRRLFWDKLIATQRLRYRLEYQVLSKRYRLSMPAGHGGRLRFASLEAALDELGRIRGLALPADAGIRGGDYVRIRSRLNVEALPSPLRPVAYLQDRWRLESPWKRLEIR